MSERKDALAAVAAEALALRLLSRYRAMRESVEHYAGDISRLPAPPSFRYLETRYVEAMHTITQEHPETTAAEMLYLDLVGAIVADEISPHEGPVAAPGEDLCSALQIIGGLRRIANTRDIAEGIAAERAAWQGQAAGCGGSLATSRP